MSSSEAWAGTIARGQAPGGHPRGSAGKIILHDNRW
jgi:hypothetical protein